MKKIWLAIFAIVAWLWFVVSSASAASVVITKVGGQKMYSSKDIVSNVVNAPNLTTLVAAVKAAWLVETLQSDGPFTVFGPDNNAFAKLPAGTVETLVKPENKDLLVKILTYHVVSGKYTTKNLKNWQVLKTVQWWNLKVSKVTAKMKHKGKIYYSTTIKLVDENWWMSKIIVPNVYQKNGIAHVIDTVLMPKAKIEMAMTNDKMMKEDSMMKEDKMMKETTVMVWWNAMYSSKDIVSNVVNAPNLTTLVAAVKAAWLVETLQSDGPFTVFGPDNNAFAKLPAGTVETLVKPENKDLLVKILTYHVVSGKYTASDLTDGQILTSVQGGKLTINKKDWKVMITDEKWWVSNVIVSDVLQKNGVAHVVDTVLMPK